MFKLEINTENAAFEGEAAIDEIDILLHTVVSQVSRGLTSGKILDSNGNTVGSWEWTK